MLRPPLPSTANDVRLVWARRGETEPLLIRQAVAMDQVAIVELVHSERLNPNGLAWQNFVVAVQGHTLVGAVQMRQHPEGSLELGSLVVRRDHRGHGIAGRLIGALLAQHPGRVHVITRSTNAAHYRPWGFVRIEPRAAPRTVRRQRLIGQMVSVISLLTGRRPRRLVILRREPGYLAGAGRNSSITTPMSTTPAALHSNAVTVSPPSVTPSAMAITGLTKV
jgi:N-acetylglutamate synthase-like GNAT family acetyltransferase